MRALVIVALVSGVLIGVGAAQTLQKINPPGLSKPQTYTHVFRAEDVAAVRAKYFGTSRPASTLVQIARLASPEFKVEIEAIAVVP